MAKRFLKGVRYAWTGLRLAWREELSFRIEVVCAALVLLCGFLLNISTIEYVLIILVVSCVLTAEAFNTALEELCDKFQPTHDPHIAKIKDLAAAAVLLMSVGALLIGLIIFIPYLI